MKFKLEPLPYDEDALEPHISKKTVQYHYGKHHQGYMNKLKKAIADTPEAEQTLLEIIKKTKSKSTYNLAAQVWNHTFYWQSMSPNGGGKPPSSVEKILNKHFDSLDHFKKEFTKAANSQFGSGWAWLVKDNKDDYKIITTSNAKNPIKKNLTPIFTLDVWEHAYYLDYQNDRNLYIETFFDHLINWEHVSNSMDSGS